MENTFDLLLLFSNLSNNQELEIYSNHLSSSVNCAVGRDVHLLLKQMLSCKVNHTGNIPYAVRNVVPCNSLNIYHTEKCFK